MTEVGNKNHSILIIVREASLRRNIKMSFSKVDFEIFTVNTGEEGIKYINRYNPYIVIVEWLIPGMTGLEVTEQIRSSKIKQPIIIVLSDVNSSAAKTMILNYGADYCFSKPIEYKSFSDDVKKLISNHKLPAKSKLVKTTLKRKDVPFGAVGIAASTGGPPTIKYLFENLGTIKNTAFFITQHGPRWMLKSSVESLQRKTDMNVHLGIEDLPVKPGEIYIAPGDRHMTVGMDLKIHLLNTPPVNYVRPSADPMLQSIAEVFGGNSIGIVLTGMGSDASIGCGYIYAEGGKIIVEDPATAIIHSMPNSVIKFKLADVVVPIDKMPLELLKAIQEMQ